MYKTVIIILGYPINSKDNILQKRLKKGLNIAQQQQIKQIIVSGHGRNEEIEADYMAIWLKKHGFTGQIIQETQSRDTIENLVFCAKILPELNIQKVIIVTSWFHAQRTRTIAEQVLTKIPFSLSLSQGGGLDLLKAENKYQSLLTEVIKHKTLAEIILERDHRFNN